jgi:hypothetical protein
VNAERIAQDFGGRRVVRAWSVDVMQVTPRIVDVYAR